MAASCITLVAHKGMLPFIAERTGALCFDDDDQLERLLERIFQADPTSLRRLARTQYDKVHSHFDVNTFCWQFISLIRGTAMSRA
jgi:hypothetical protein